MRVKLLKHLAVVFLAAGLASLAGCAGGVNSAQPGALAANGNQSSGGEPQAGGREVALGEEFKLGKDEKVSVKATGLTIELKGVKRSWYANGGGEFPEADVAVTLDGKEERRWMKLGETIKSGEYIVKLSGADPFGKTGAELIVTRG